MCQYAAFCLVLENIFEQAHGATLPVIPTVNPELLISRTDNINVLFLEGIERIGERLGILRSIGGKLLFEGPVMGFQ